MENGKRIDFSVKAFIVNEGKFLIMHKNKEKGDFWELPGGRMEFGESAEETLRRELLEETGLLVEPVKVLDTWNVVYEKYQVTGVIYLCKVDNIEVRLSDEHDRCMWIDLGKESLGSMYEAYKKKMINWDWNNIQKEL